MVTLIPEEHHRILTITSFKLRHKNSLPKKWPQVNLENFNRKIFFRSDLFRFSFYFLCKSQIHFYIFFFTIYGFLENKLELLFWRSLCLICCQFKTISSPAVKSPNDDVIELAGIISSVIKRQIEKLKNHKNSFKIVR